MPCTCKDRIPMSYWVLRPGEGLNSNPAQQSGDCPLFSSATEVFEDSSFTTVGMHH